MTRLAKGKVGPFRLTLRTADEREGFAHDCLVAGTRRTVGFTFYQIEQFDLDNYRVEGEVAAMVWMPTNAAAELHRQLGEALARLAQAGEDEVVTVDHTPRQRPAQ